MTIPDQAPPLAAEEPPVPVYSVPAPQAKNKIENIVVFGHSSLIYWWPVWLVSFILAALTYAEGDRTSSSAMINSNGPGLVFVATLLAVAVSSTVVLRGMVSIVAIVTLIAAAVAFGWIGWWVDILKFLGGLEIRINETGYLCIGTPLFLAWLTAIFFYDRMHYANFGRGQIRYVLEVGDGEVAMPSDGAIVEKKRSDVFRHWVLGLGSGDLIIRSGGPNSPKIELKMFLTYIEKCPSSIKCCARRPLP